MSQVVNTSGGSESATYFLLMSRSSGASRLSKAKCCLIALVSYGVALVSYCVACVGLVSYAWRLIPDDEKSVLPP